MKPCLSMALAVVEMTSLFRYSVSVFALVSQEREWAGIDTSLMLNYVQNILTANCQHLTKSPCC